MYIELFQHTFSNYVYRKCQSASKYATELSCNRTLAILLILLTDFSSFIVFFTHLSFNIFRISYEKRDKYVFNKMSAMEML